MTCAYSEWYVPYAQTALGGMLHYAAYDLKIELPKFYRMFISSGIADAFGRGNPKYIAGMSGVELAREVIHTVTNEYEYTEPDFAYHKTPEYWAGWAVAYYEWCTGMSFDRIDQFVSITEIVEMYSPYHEADITRFVEAVDSKIQSRHTHSQLARLRAYVGLSQKALSELSGVSVRMIEQYEQGRKDISHASSATVYKLSRALSCRMEDLIG